MVLGSASLSHLPAATDDRPTLLAAGPTSLAAFAGAGPVSWEPAGGGAGPVGWEPAVLPRFNQQECCTSSSHQENSRSGDKVHGGRWEECVQ